MVELMVLGSIIPITIQVANFHTLEGLYLVPPGEAQQQTLSNAVNTITVTRFDIDDDYSLRSNNELFVECVQRM